MNLCFDSRAGIDEVFKLIIKKLKNRKGINITCAVHNAFEAKVHKRLGINVEYVLEDYLRTNWDRLPADTRQIKSYEQMYHFEVPLWQMIYSDRHLRNKNKSYVYKTITGMIQWWEQIIEDKSPDFIVSETVVGMWNYIPYVLCKSGKCRFAGLLPLRLIDRFYITDDLFGHSASLEQEYQRVKTEVLTEQEQKKVSDFIEKFIHYPKQPYYMQFTARSSRITGFPRFLGHMLQNFIEYYFLGKNDYTVPKPLPDAVKIFRRIVKGKYVGKYYRFDKPDFQKKYVLFPLQYYPEASTDIWAPYRKNQLEIIRQVAQSLPMGCELYVKEHTALLGFRDISVYKKIQSLPNVRLLSPFCKTAELIANCDAVCTITSTVGLEAIIFDKPVILLGNVFYDCYEGIIKVGQMESLPRIFQEVLEKDKSQYPELEDRLKFVYSYLKAGQPGRMVLRLTKNDNREKIAEELAEGLIKELNFLKKQKELAVHF